MNQFRNMLVAALITVAVQGGVHNVMDFGAKGDGVSYDTVAIRKAAAAVSSDSAGGTLLFPSGRTFLTGAFNVTSNTHVEIEHGATVLGSTRGEDWPLVVARTVWPQMGECVGFGTVVAAYSCLRISAAYSCRTMCVKRSAYPE